MDVGVGVEVLLTEELEGLAKEGEAFKERGGGAKDEGDAAAGVGGVVDEGVGLRCVLAIGSYCSVEHFIV